MKKLFVLLFLLFSFILVGCWGSWPEWAVDWFFKNYSKCDIDLAFKFVENWEEVLAQFNSLYGMTELFSVMLWDKWEEAGIVEDIKDSINMGKQCKDWKLHHIKSYDIKKTSYTDDTHARVNVDINSESGTDNQYFNVINKNWEWLIQWSWDW